VAFGLVHLRQHGGRGSAGDALATMARLRAGILPS
jgi:hypothetical protein